MTEVNLPNSTESPFAYPESFEDRKWKWRENFQNKVMLNEHSLHVMNVLKYANTYKTKNNNKIKTIRKSSILKFGCPLHDLKPSLVETNYECPRFVLCNGYSPQCCNLITDKQRLIKCGEWTFQDLHITSDNISLIKTPLIIQLISNENNKNEKNTNNTNDNNNGIISTIIPINILRTNEATFEKRFRPGSYRYDGKPFNQCQENAQNMQKRHQFISSTKMGTWFFGKLFYVRKNDVVLLPLIENNIYLQIILHSDECNKKRDGLYDIIGGVGLCMLARHRNDGIHNCIMLRSNDHNINNVLKKSRIIIYKLDTISNTHVNIYINNDLLNLSTTLVKQTLLDICNNMMENNNNDSNDINTNKIVNKNGINVKKRKNKVNKKKKYSNVNQIDSNNTNNLLTVQPKLEMNDNPIPIDAMITAHDINCNKNNHNYNDPNKNAPFCCNLNQSHENQQQIFVNPHFDNEQYFIANNDSNNIRNGDNPFYLNMFDNNIDNNFCQDRVEFTIPFSSFNSKCFDECEFNEPINVANSNQKNLINVQSNTILSMPMSLPPAPMHVSDPVCATEPVLGLMPMCAPVPMTMSMSMPMPMPVSLSLSNSQSCHQYQHPHQHQYQLQHQLHSQHDSNIKSHMNHNHITNNNDNNGYNNEKNMHVNAPFNDNHYQDNRNYYCSNENDFNILDHNGNFWDNEYDFCNFDNCMSYELDFDNNNSNNNNHILPPILVNENSSLTNTSRVSDGSNDLHINHDRYWHSLSNNDVNDINHDISVKDNYSMMGMAPMNKKRKLNSCHCYHPNYNCNCNYSYTNYNYHYDDAIDNNNNCF